jgi:hypothetical protein
MEHTWVEEEVDCAQVGWDIFRTCSVCGVSQSHDGTFTYMAGYGNPRFSTDCTLAQRELHLYLLGRLDGLGAAFEGPDSEGRAIAGLLRKAVKEEKPYALLFRVLKTVENIQGRPAPRDVQRELGL